MSKETDKKERTLKMKTLVKNGWLTLNRICNNRCVWCYAGPTGFNKPEMDFELAGKLIQLFHDIGVKSVILIGGEPTMYTKLIQVVEKCISMNIDPVLVTNGLRLKDKMYLKDLRGVGLKKISVSVKGLNSDEYREITGNPNGYSDMVSGISNIKETDCELSVSFTITDVVVKDVEKFVKGIINLGVKHVNFDLVSPVISKNGVIAERMPSPNELATAVEKIHYKIKGLGISYGFYLSIPLCLLSDRVRKEFADENLIVTTCHIYKGTGLIFDQEGRILPCNHFTDFPVGKFGEDFDSAESFKLFWENPSMAENRRKLLKFPVEKCSDCSDWNSCGGGCLIKWLHWNPKDSIV